jgi:RTX toxin RtxA
MVGSANIFTHIGNGFSVAFAIGQANIVTKMILAVPPIIKAALNPLPIWVNILPPAENINANVGPLPTLVKKLAPTDTIKAALMPLPTNGITLAAMVGSANIFTHIGNGFSVAFAIGQANIVTKIGSGDLMKIFW